MVWILHPDNGKPVSAPLSSEMAMNAPNVYLTYQEARAAQQKQCKHPTWIGHAGTGHTQCADCGWRG